MSGGTRLRTVGVSALALTALTLAGCSSSGSGGSGGSKGEPFRILVSAGTSAEGSLGDTGKLVVLAAKAASNVLNAQGGVLGHHVEIDVVNDAGDPATATSVLQKQLASSKPVVYTNSGPSTVSAAVLPILNQNKILSFNAGPTADSANAGKFPLNFDMPPSPATYATAWAGYAKERGYKSVALLTPNDAFGEPEAAAMKSDLRTAGIRVTGSQTYDDTTLDVTSQLVKLKQGNPQALFFSAYGAPAGYVLQDVKKLGWQVPLVGDIATSDSTLLSTPAPRGLLGTAAEQNFKYQVFTSTVQSPSAPANTKKMLTAFRKVGAIPASIALATSYDAIMLAAAAAKKAGTVTDTAKMAKAIGTLSAGDAPTGINPAYKYSEQSHSPTLGQDAFSFIAPANLTGGLFVRQS